MARGVKRGRFIAAVAILLLSCFCVVDFRNAFAVGAADGSAADASSTGKVKVQPDASKKGTVLRANPKMVIL